MQEEDPTRSFVGCLLPVALGEQPVGVVARRHSMSRFENRSDSCCLHHGRLFVNRMIRKYQSRTTVGHTLLHLSVAWSSRIDNWPSTTAVAMCFEQGRGRV